MAYIGALIPLLFVLCLFAFLGILWRRIFGRMGYNPVWGLLMLLPLANLVMLVALAFSRWPVQQTEGKILRMASTRGAPLPVAAMVVIICVGVVPVAAVCAAVSVPGIMRTRMALQEEHATQSLESISEAFETYGALHESYPRQEEELTAAEPAYLSRSYNRREIRGYRYLFTFWPDGYKVVAEPVHCDRTGRKVFTLTPGGIIRQEECP